MAQDTPLYHDFTPAELLTMGERLNRRWDAGVARERLAVLGIPPNTRVGRLSGGQRAQVALALCLAKQPRLLLLDEPVASLDPLARREFLQLLMGSVADTGMTVLFSSHIVADLERACDYLVVLHSSRVKLTGAVEDLITGHRQIVGPRHDGGPIPRVAQVVRASHTDRQSTMLVQTDGVLKDPLWTVYEVGLEEIVLAYLGGTSGDVTTARAEWGVSA